VNKTNDAIVTTIKLAADVRAQLAAWAEHNLSSMTAELNRAVRERAEREKRHATVAGEKAGAA
jgi:hypothetical protein